MHGARAPNQTYLKQPQTMEPILNPRSEQRLAILKNWLQSIAGAHGLNISSLQPASSDASFRRYYRLQTDAGTAIVMDAPPEQEDCRPFLHVTGLLEHRSEEHTSELQSLMRISYAVFCLKKKNIINTNTNHTALIRTIHKSNNINS